jgi:hypothetical protein
MIIFKKAQVAPALFCFMSNADPAKAQLQHGVSYRFIPIALA